MAATLPLCLLSTWLLFSPAVADDCDPYIFGRGTFSFPRDCSSYQFCCGSCDNCCSPLITNMAGYTCKLGHKKTCTTTFGYVESLPTQILEKYVFLWEKQRDNSMVKPIEIGSAIGGVILLIIIFIACCVCPCCCLYKMCRKTRPVVTTATHPTVISSQCPQQQPANPGAQYQNIPAEPGHSRQLGYGGQPMPAAPYQGQPYALGPPPSYHESDPGYPVPYSQAAYDGGQPPYSLQPPTQPGYAHPPQPTDYGAVQPPYNPAYDEPPKTRY